MTTRRQTLTIATALVAVIMLANAFEAKAAPAREPEPRNKIAILLDTSGSFRGRQAEALDRVLGLLDAIATVKVHRWDPDSDEIALISLDAMPAKVWNGTLRELKGSDRTSLVARFKARGDYASCTDITAGFQLAAHSLEGDPRYVHKYLVAFTDLVDEPPTRSPRTCRPVRRPSLPAETFPWEALHGVDTSVLWVPPEQKMAWARAVTERGLQESFKLYTTAESSSVQLTPPRRPEVVKTSAEAEAERQQTIARLGSFGTGVMKLVGVLVVLLVVVLGVAFWHARSRPARRPAPQVIRVRPGARTPRPASARAARSPTAN